MQPILGSGDATVGSLLLEQAERWGDRPFVVFDDGTDDVLTLGFADVVLLARRGVSSLRRAGVGPGDRFALVLGNSLEFLAFWFGASLCGAVMVPCNPDSTADELRHILSHAGCRAAVHQPSTLDAVRVAADPSVSLVAAMSVWKEAPAAISSAELPDPLAPLGVLYTSGTTSRPKGVVITHANYLHVGRSVGDHARLRPDDRWLVVLPLFHANAQYYCFMSALTTGASVALMSRFSASRWAAQAVRHGATVGSLFAAPIRMILAHPEDPVEASCRLRFTYFAQNLTDEQLTTFERRFGCSLAQIYGMTETIAPPLMNPILGRRDNHTIGVPPAGAWIRIADADGIDVARGVPGELLVHGEPGITLMAGYLDDPAATAEAIQDGWLRTGDVVCLEADGYVSFRDRVKHMIKRSGENIAAAEIELAVNQHPAVFESAAVGVPDAMRDEAIKVFVVPHEGATVAPDEIIAFCATRLVKFKVPSYVEIVGELPRTSVGKIQKHRLPTSTTAT